MYVPHSNVRTPHGHTMWLQPSSLKNLVWHLGHSRIKASLICSVTNIRISRYADRANHFSSESGTVTRARACIRRRPSYLNLLFDLIASQRNVALLFAQATALLHALGILALEHAVGIVLYDARILAEWTRLEIRDSNLHICIRVNTTSDMALSLSLVRSLATSPWYVPLEALQLEHDA